MPDFIPVSFACSRDASAIALVVQPPQAGSSSPAVTERCACGLTVDGETGARYRISTELAAAVAFGLILVIAGVSTAVRLVWAQTRRAVN